MAEWVSLEYNLKDSTIFTSIPDNQPNSILNFYFNVWNQAIYCTFEAYDDGDSKGYISNSKMGQASQLNSTSSSNRDTDTVFVKSDAYTFVTSYTKDDETFSWWIEDDPNDKDQKMYGNGEWNNVKKSDVDQQMRLVFTQTMTLDEDKLCAITPLYYIGQDANDSEEYLSFDYSDSGDTFTVVVASGNTDLGNKRWQIDEWWEGADIQLTFLKSSLLSSTDSVCTVDINKHKDGTIFPTIESQHSIRGELKIHSSYHKLNPKRSPRKKCPCDYGNYFYISLKYDHKSYFLHHSNKYGSQLKFKEFKHFDKDKQLEKCPFYVRYPFPHLAQHVGYICTKPNTSARGDPLYVHYDDSSKIFTLSNNEYTLFCM